MPIHNENKRFYIIFNGEIFNYIELKEDLIKRGHAFYTESDTEVIVHLYEEMGYECLNLLNGQFAIAIWDNQKKELFLARDRVGNRPLFYAKESKAFIFASEIKAIFASGKVIPEISPCGLDQIFTFWANMPGGTIFKRVHELEPAHFLIINKDHGNNFRIERYWNLSFTNNYSSYKERGKKDYYMSKLFDLLDDAVRLRLRADVPVAAYLSGGLDSTIIATLIKKRHKNSLKTFSVNFRDEDYDEKAYQREARNYLGVDHESVLYDACDIYNYFEKVIWLTERPILRAAPVPLFLLSRLVHDNNIKVVLTGEGADEFFGGYNIFKETKIRLFLSRQPNSAWRLNLLRKLYPFMGASSMGSGKFWEIFFKKNVTETDDIFYSHRIRWGNTSWIKRFLSPRIKEEIKDVDLLGELESYINKCVSSNANSHADSVNSGLSKMHPFLRAQYLEIIIFMSAICCLRRETVC
jgi:asparagine synthase (glutamine-hydrolysing)